RLDFPADATVRIDVGNLADAYDFTATLHQLVEDCRRRRRHREVAPVPRAHERATVVTDERPRDDAADVVRIHQLARDPAQLVETFQPECFFMARDLEHAVRRGVHDRLTRPHVFLAELFYYRRP